MPLHHGYSRWDIVIPLDTIICLMYIKMINMVPYRGGAILDRVPVHYSLRVDEQGKHKQ